MLRTAGGWGPRCLRTRRGLREAWKTPFDSNLVLNVTLKYICMYVCIYLFGHIGSQLQHAGSLLGCKNSWLQHVRSDYLTWD